MAQPQDELKEMIEAGSELHGHSLALHVLLEAVNPTFNKKQHLFGEAQASDVQQTLLFLGSQIQCNLDRFSSRVEALGLDGFQALQNTKP